MSRPVADQLTTSLHSPLMVSMIVVPLIAVVMLAFTRFATMSPSVSGSAATWNLEIASTGTRAVQALVYDRKLAHM